MSQTNLIGKNTLEYAAAKKFRFDLFIAYHGTDETDGSCQHAEKIYDFLTQKGIKCYFFPKTGDSHFGRTPEMAADSANFLLVCNKNIKVDEGGKICSGFINEELTAFSDLIISKKRARKNLRAYTFDGFTAEMANNLYYRFNNVAHFDENMCTENECFQKVYKWIVDGKIEYEADELIIEDNVNTFVSKSLEEELYESVKQKEPSPAYPQNEVAQNRIIEEIPAQIVPDSNDKPVTEEKKKDEDIISNLDAANNDTARSETIHSDIFNSDTGDGRSKNDVKAFLNVKRLAECGDMQAQYELACHYEKQNELEEAVKWYEKAVKQGHLEAQLQLGNCFEHGRGVNVDIERAYFWYRKAAKGGLPEAQFRYALQLRGTLSARNKYKDRLKSAAYNGHIGANIELAKCYLEGENLNEAILCYGRATAHAAEQEDPRNLLELGKLYSGDKYSKVLGLVRWADDGYVSKIMSEIRDYKKAVKCFTLVANMKNGDDYSIADAQYKLGEWFFEGNGVAQDDNKAFYWLEKSLKTYPGALNRMAVANCLYYGIGTDKDYERAFNLYCQEVAESEKPGLSHEMVAECFYYGRGTHRDYERAVSMCLDIENDDRWGRVFCAHAMLILGICRLTGNGISKNVTKGYQQVLSEIAGADREGNRCSPCFYNPVGDDLFSEGLYQLGMCQYDGIGTSQDFEGALEDFKESAELCNVNAMVMLAKCYRYAQGQDTPSPKSAMEWIIRAKEAGNNEATDLCGAWVCEMKETETPEEAYALGYYFENEGNIEFAASQYKKAAKAGCKEAKAALSTLLDKMPFSQRMKLKLGKFH